MQSRSFCYLRDLPLGLLFWLDRPLIPEELLLLLLEGAEETLEEFDGAELFEETLDEGRLIAELLEEFEVEGRLIEELLEELLDEGRLIAELLDEPEVEGRLIAELLEEFLVEGRLIAELPDELFVALRLVTLLLLEVPYERDEELFTDGLLYVVDREEPELTVPFTEDGFVTVLPVTDPEGLRVVLLFELTE